MNAPCPDRQAEFDSFLDTGVMTLAFRRHHEVCVRCRDATVTDPRFDALVQAACDAMMRFPQPDPSGMMEDDA